MARESIAASDPQRVREDRAIFRALRIVERRAGERGELVSDPSSAARLFRLSLANEEREHFECAFLDSRHRLIARERLFSGTIDGAEVAPRVVVQRALILNAAAVIAAHNHPSGSPDPSAADLQITQRLRQALALVDVRLLDHLVVYGRGATSLAACAWMWPPANAGMASAPVRRTRGRKPRAIEPEAMGREL